MSVYDKPEYWFKEIDNAKKRAKKFIKQGKKIYNIYKSEDEEKVPFNILYSNTDTLIPALYSDTPMPVVKRKNINNRGDDKIIRAASVAAESMLQYLIDTSIDEYESLDDTNESVVIDALIPGRGLSVIKYESSVENDEIKYEHVCTDHLCWDKVLIGDAKKWTKVPYIAIEECIDKAEAERLFGKKIANELKYTTGDKEKDERLELEPEEAKNEKKTTQIYQIWDKDGGKKLRYVSEQIKDKFLSVEDDPFGLSGFFPMPEPLVLVANASDMCPIPMYKLYEQQAEELNIISRRIIAVTKAIKVKGVYDSTLQADIQNLLSGDDLDMIPAEKPAALSQEKGFENYIWFLPVEQLIKVLRELTAAREQIKQVIYEITGISDIIRGSTVASETATAQSIKSQWGTMRLKRYQRLVQRYCRDQMRIMLEMAVTKMSVQSWVSATGLQYATDEQVAQAQMIMANAGTAQQNPQLQQIIAQAQAILQQPKWSEILGILNDDLLRSYSIDVETNSTIQPEATEDKQNINEAVSVIGSYMRESLPAVQGGIVPFGLFKGVLLKIARQYQFGEDIENELDQFQQPAPPPPPKQAPDNSLQIEQMRQQAGQAKLQQDMQVEVGRSKIQLDIEQMRIAAERELTQMKLEAERQIAMDKATIDAETKLKIAALELQQKEIENADLSIQLS